MPSDINYVELQLPPAKPLLDIANEEEIEGSPGKYAQLAELQKELEKEQQIKCVFRLICIALQLASRY